MNGQARLLQMNVGQLQVWCIHKGSEIKPWRCGQVRVKLFEQVQAIVADSCAAIAVAGIQKLSIERNVHLIVYPVVYQAPVAC